MISKDFDVATFVDHLVYRWLRDEYYPDLLFTTGDMAVFRKAVTSGFQLPVVALARTSPPLIELENYGRSVTARTLEYEGELVTAQIVDYTVHYSFYAAGYLMTFLNEVYQTVTGLDMERFFTFDLSQVLPPNGRTRVEFKKTTQDLRTEFSEEQAARKLYISVDWDLKITVPCISSAKYLERVEIMLNGTPISVIGG